MEDSDEELTRKLLEAVAGHLPAPPPAAAGSPPCPAAGAPSASTSWWASYDWNAGGFFVGDEWWEKDAEEEGLWWRWKQGKSRSRFRDQTVSWHFLASTS